MVVSGEKTRGQMAQEMRFFQARTAALTRRIPAGSSLRIKPDARNLDRSGLLREA